MVGVVKSKKGVTTSMGWVDKSKKKSNYEYGGSRYE